MVLAGYRSDSAIIVSRANVCVVPSVWHDAFPLAVLEAMARARAVIATNVGGIPELIEHDVTGLLVPPGDETALAEAIAALLADPARAARLGEAARERVAERFTPEAQLRRLSALVEEGFGAPCEAVAG
jgi:glycosyltransferase involved in cell wall biosynthesis